MKVRRTGSGIRSGPWQGRRTYPRCLQKWGAYVCGKAFQGKGSQLDVPGFAFLLGMKRSEEVGTDLLFAAMGTQGCMACLIGFEDRRDGFYSLRLVYPATGSLRLQGAATRTGQTLVFLAVFFVVRVAVGFSGKRQLRHSGTGDVTSMAGMGHDRGAGGIHRQQHSQASSDPFPENPIVA